jgi:hypothetical protein
LIYTSLNNKIPANYVKRRIKSSSGYLHKTKPKTKSLKTNKSMKGGLMELNFLQVKETSGDAVHSPNIVVGLMAEEARADRECFWVLHPRLCPERNTLFLRNSPSTERE